MSYIFTFTSRNGAMRFYDAVGDNGGSARLVNTPQGAGVGCGLSVRCTDLRLCKDILRRGHFPDFYAAYEFDGENYTTIRNVNT